MVQMWAHPAEAAKHMGRWSTPLSLLKNLWEGAAPVRVIMLVARQLKLASNHNEWKKALSSFPWIILPRIRVKNVLDYVHNKIMWKTIKNSTYRTWANLFSGYLSHRVCFTVQSFQNEPHPGLDGDCQPAIWRELRKQHFSSDSMQPLYSLRFIHHLFWQVFPTFYVLIVSQMLTAASPNRILHSLQLNIFLYFPAFLKYVVFKSN